MSAAELSNYMSGALVMGCLIIGLKFMKYWRLARDRFFIFFALAFWAFGVGWVLRALVPTTDEHAHLVFLPRLVGFSMILFGIFDKNRRARDD
ncbi:MAG TPA: DUF5985 family protein [Kofleriaceae bacterium]|nr:DUF5985 family protein [Kofleriaceae bacterium]